MDAAHVERIITLLQENIDWNYLLKLVFRHNLVSLFYRNIETVAPAALPETVRAELREQVQVNIQGNLFLTKELLHLLALFDQHGIPAVPYKGPVLATAVYGNLALRPSSDLDILVHERHILPAMDFLAAQGYQIIRPTSIATLDKSLRSLMITQWVENSPWAYQLVLWHPERQGIVELHWRITPRYVFPNGSEELWADLKPVTFGGLEILSFSPENLLWFLCVHGAKHQWKRFGWLCDVAELIRVHPGLNWQRILAQVEKLGIERRLYLGLLLANGALGSPLPEAIETKIYSTPQVKALAKQVMEGAFDERERTSRFLDLERFAFQLRAIDRMADRGRYLQRFAVELTSQPKLSGHL
jgi:hypothetical protein